MSEKIGESFWTPENAHEGVEEMENHINAIIGALSDLAARIDKSNPEIAATSVLKQHQVGGGVAKPQISPGPAVAARD